MSKKDEFSIKNIFEEEEKKKSKEYIKAHREPVYFWKTFGWAILGAICGGLIYFAEVWFLKGESCFFFILSGLGAYTFAFEFTKPEMKNKYQIWFILMADILGVIISLLGVFTLTPIYTQQSESLGLNPWQTMYYSLVTQRNYLFWVMCFLCSLLGIFIGILICRGSKKKGKKK